MVAAPDEAARAYTEALAANVNDPIAIRRRIIELRTLSGALQGDRLLAELDAFLTTTLRGEHQTSDVLWAARQRVEMYLDQGRAAEAEAFLDTLAPAIPATAPEADRNLYEFLRAWAVYQQDRLDEAERMLRPARRLTVRDDVDAASGWLLGRIMQLHASPEVALSLLDRVRDALHGALVVASKFGRAEVLWQLQRHASRRRRTPTRVRCCPASRPRGASTPAWGAPRRRRRGIGR